MNVDGFLLIDPIVVIAEKTVLWELLHEIKRSRFTWILHSIVPILKLGNYIIVVRNISRLESYLLKISNKCFLIKVEFDFITLAILVFNLLRWSKTFKSASYQDSYLWRNRFGLHYWCRRKDNCTLTAFIPNSLPHFFAWSLVNSYCSFIYAYDLGSSNHRNCKTKLSFFTIAKFTSIRLNTFLQSELVDNRWNVRHFLTMIYSNKWCNKIKSLEYCQIIFYAVVCWAMSN